LNSAKFLLYLLIGVNAATLTFFISHGVKADTLNLAPDCDSAYAIPGDLWPPNHSLKQIAISGVTDPDGDSVSLVAQCIVQDEPLNGSGDGSNEPDATGLGSNSPSVRAERSGNGDGRVYHLVFKASDTSGASCVGQVSVEVPHIRKSLALDSGLRIKSVPGGVNCNAQPFNNRPVIYSDPVTEGAEASVYRYQVLGHDPGQDVLGYSLEAAPEGMQMDAQSGLITWTPNYEQAGSYELVVRVSDRELGASQRFTLKIANTNRAPYGENQTLSLLEDTSINIVLAGADEDGDPVTGEIQAVTAKGKLTGDFPNYTYTPNPNFFGEDSFHYQLTDGIDVSEIYEIALVIEPVNDAPVITSTPNLEVDPGQDFQYQVIAEDVDDPVLGYVLIQGPAGMEVSADGLLTWSVDEFVDGTHLVELKVQDAAGAIASQSFELELLLNQKPVILSSPVTQAITNTFYRYQVVAEDPDGDSLGYSLLSGPTGMQIDTETGLINWIASADSVGQYLVEVKVSDSSGQSSTQSFDVFVTQPESVPDNTGTDFWITRMLQFIGGTDTVQKIYISSQHNTNGKLEFFDRTEPEFFTVEAGQVTEIEVVVETGTIRQRNVTQNFGMHLTAEDDISVYSSLEGIATSDAYSVLPVTALGTEYRVMAYENTYSGSQFDVLAIENDTVLTIRLPEAMDNVGIPQSDVELGESYQITLQEGQNYHLKLIGNPLNYDLTGALIESNKPVAVTSGHALVRIPLGYVAADQIYEQLLPTSQWGNKYFVSPLLTRMRGDTLRILAAKDNTQITINGQIAARLDAGEFHERIVSVNSEIKADKPILVAQFSNSDSFDLTLREQQPGYYFESGILADSDDYQTQYNVEIGQPPAINYVMVVLPVNALDQLMLNGESVSADIFTESQVVTGFAIAQLVLAPGTHNLESTVPFGIYKNIDAMEASSDPFMAILPAPQQFLSNYVFISPPGAFRRHFLNISVPTYAASSVVLDGRPIARELFTPVSTSGYSAARIAVNAGEHQISADAPFGILVYGYDWYNSYGYLGGFGTESQAEVADIQLQVNNQQFVLEQEFCAIVTAVDIDDQPIIRAVVDVSVQGVNDREDRLFTDKNGQAAYCYTGILTGMDALSFTSKNMTKSISVDWLLPSGENVAPYISSTPELVAERGAPYTYQVIAADLNEDALEYSLVQPPLGMTLDASSGLLHWPLAVGDDVPVTLQVSDGNTSTTQSFNLSVNAFPRVTTEPAKVWEEGVFRNTRIFASDEDGEQVVFTLEEAPPGMTLELVGGRINYANVPAGTYPVDILLSDRRGGTFLYAYTLEIVPRNLPPQFTQDSYSISTYARELMEFDLGVVDLEGDEFTYSASLQPGMSLDQEEGILKWIPADSQTGFKPVTVKVVDERGKSNSRVVRITVLQPRAPLIALTPDQTGYENGSFSYSVEVSDTDSPNLTYALIDPPAGMTISDQGLVEWNPNIGDQGNYAIHIVVTDENGYAAHSVFLSDN